MTPYRVLFVCTGNICRSPTAEAVARAVATQRGVAHLFVFDSAGTHAYHTGGPPDRRSVAAAAKRGYRLNELRARPVTTFDFSDFDYILALDQGHLNWLQQACPLPQRHKLKLFMVYAERFTASEVPDPYYGGSEGFELVLDRVEDAAEGLVKALTVSPESA